MDDDAVVTTLVVFLCRVGCDLLLPDGSQSSGGSGMCPSRHDINKLISHVVHVSTGYQGRTNLCFDCAESVRL